MNQELVSALDSDSELFSRPPAMSKSSTANIFVITMLERWDTIIGVRPREN